MSNEENIRQLMHIELNTFNEDELEDGVTIAISVDGFQHSLDSWEYDTVDEIVKAIDDEMWTSEVCMRDDSLVWRMLDWMIAVLFPDVELETEEGTQAFENDLSGLMSSPGFEEEFGRDVPDELLNTVLDLEYEVYQKRATIVYNKQLTQGDEQ